MSTLLSLSSASPESISDELVNSIKKLVVTSSVDGANETLVDGSRIIYTFKSIRTDVELVMLSPGTAAVNDGDDDTYVDTLHLIYNEKSSFGYVSARPEAIEGGSTLFDEMPVAYICLFDDAPSNRLSDRPTARRLLPKFPAQAHTMTSIFSGEDKSFDEVPASLEWTLTYIFVTSHSETQVRDIVKKMAQPGRYSYSNELRRHFTGLPEKMRALKDTQDRLEQTQDELEVRLLNVNARKLRDDVEEQKKAYGGARAWISKILLVTKGSASFTIDEVCIIYGCVMLNSLHMRAPFSRDVYGMALYPGASHFSHSCDPNARAVFGEQGLVRIEAARTIMPNEAISIDRVFGNQPLIRCLQTSPEWLSSAANASLGSRCTCDECVRTLNWLRSKCDENFSGGENRDGSLEASPLNLETDKHKLEAVSRAIKSTWIDDEAQSISNANERSKKALFFLKYPLTLSSVSNPTNIVCAIDRACLMSHFVSPHYLLKSFSLARAVLRAAVIQPCDVTRVLGEDCVESARKYALGFAVKFLQRKLAQQGASDDLIKRRTCTYSAWAHYTVFVSRISYPIINTLRTHTDDDGPLNLFLRKKLTDDNVRERFWKVWKILVMSCNTSILNNKVANAIAADSATRMLHLQSLQSRIIGLTVQLLDL